MAFQLQLLHASDLEGGVDAIQSAPNFAAIVDVLEDTSPNTILISAGDNYIPGPFFSAAGDPSIQPVLRSVYDTLFGLPTGTLSGLTALEGRIDISIMNILGFDASALGNHEFDLGTNTISTLINDGIPATPTFGGTTWLGARFPYLSANLNFSGDTTLNPLFTSSILDSSAFFPLGAGTPGVLDAADLAALRTAPKLAQATVVDADGNPATTEDRIGVIAATTPLLETISSPGATRVSNPGAGTNDMVALASILQPVIDDVINGADNILGTADDINKIVLTTHLQQIQLEQQLIPLLRGVDISIAGGSSTLLADSEDVARGLQPGDTPAGSYPILTTNLDGNPVAVLSVDEQYQYVGRLVVDFDDNGVIIPSSIDPNVSGAFATTAAGVAALWGSNDPFAPGTKGNLVQQLTNATQTVVTTQDANIFGFTDVYIEGSRNFVRTEETTLGNLTADANLAIAQQLRPTDGVVISIKNGGGIRNPIGETINNGGATQELPPQPNPLIPGSQEGEISQLDITNSLRFNNGLTLVTLTASQLLQIVEHGVADSGPGRTPGRFPQVSGVSFSYDLTRPANDRVLSLAVTDADGNIVDVVANNSEVVGDPSRTFRIVTLNFLAGGGDGYPFPTGPAANRVDLAQLPTAPRTGGATFAPDGSEQDALAEYLLTNFPSTTPFNTPETDAAFDTRIQNLGLRADTVLINTVSGTSDRDELTGNGNALVRDRITGGSSSDTLVGDLGNDDFIYTDIRDSGDRIVDFTVGEDRIVLTALLDSIVPGGYTGTNAIADGYVQVSATSSSNSFTVDIDTDGPGGTASFTPLIVVQGPGLTLASLNNPSNFVF